MQISIKRQTESRIQVLQKVLQAWERGELAYLLPSHRSDKIPGRSNLRKERLVWATAHARGKVMGAEVQASWLHFVYSQEEMTAGAQLTVSCSLSHTVE